MFAHARLAAASLILSALVAGCTPADNPKSPQPASAAAAAAAVSSPDVHPFRIGALDAWSLKDGELAFPVGGADIPWNDAAIPTVLAAAGQPTDEVHLSIQPLLIRDGDRVVLIDTGAGGAMGTAGKLQASLTAAGVTPDQVTDILISHDHGDHVGGLVTAAGALAFPNAVVHIAAADWEHLQANPAEAALVNAVAAKVQPFAPGAVVAPNITAVALVGHTAGHTGYEIVSGADSLLYVGDALHSSVLSVAHPEWTNAWDIDGVAGVATRESLLERAATQNLRVYGGHFPYPGLGRIEKVGAGYVFVPEH
jgi:glyoxylase-like metal-dependent hydrolase (beta-lactamase superfamily II)